MTDERPTLAPATALLSLLALLVLLVPVPAAGGEAGEAARGARGRISYRLYCSSCHGASAEGDGSVAELLKVPPADLTRISLRNNGVFPFDKTYKVIDGRGVRAHGGDMPLWGNAFKKTEETVDEEVVKEKVVELVYYLKSIQAVKAK